VLIFAPACTDSTSSGSGAPSTIASSAPASTTRPFTVEHRDVTFEDTSRPTDANRSSRKLRTLLLVPEGPGPFPLVEFSHGAGSNGGAMSPFLEPIAAAGYVVAAPTFPRTNGAAGGWSNLSDYVNQPADVYFVIDSILKLAADPADRLFAKVDTEHLAVGGHSLGAMTTVGTVYNSCCAQPRVDAAIVLSGVETPFGTGTYDNQPPVPMLLAHGDLDDTVEVVGSDGLFSKATGPTAFVRYPQGSHAGILRDADGKLLAQAVIAWLDKWLLDDSTGFDALPAALQTSGVATLTTKNL
jgi:dienelactone hydrolase